MKRGLVVRDSAEIADAEWDARIGALQAFMAGEELDFALIYGDVFRSDDIGYLTNLCIYWNEGIVAVPSQGAPVFLTKLSPRVHTWMRRTSTITDLRSAKTFGQLVATLLEDYRAGAVGLVDADLWPAAVVDELRELNPDWDLRLLGSVVRDQRALPSPAEVELLRRGADILSRAADTASTLGLSVTDRVAVLERDIRGGGFTDVIINTSATDDGVVSLQVTGEYRHGWLHTSRLAAIDGETPWMSLLPAALNAAIESMRPGATLSSLAHAAQTQLAGLPDDATWHLRCVNQSDMATNGELQLCSEDPPAAMGEVVVMSLEVLFPGHQHAVVADTIMLTADGVERLTAPTYTHIVSTRLESIQ